jgi:hypothetical protein
LVLLVALHQSVRMLVVALVASELEEGPQEPVAEGLPLDGLNVVGEEDLDDAFVVVKQRAEVHQPELGVGVVGTHLHYALELVHHQGQHRYQGLRLALDEGSAVVSDQGVEFVTDVALPFLELPVLLNLLHPHLVEPIEILIDLQEPFVGRHLGLHSQPYFMVVDLLDELAVGFHTFPPLQHLLSNNHAPVVPHLVGVGQRAPKNPGEVSEVLEFLLFTAEVVTDLYKLKQQSFYAYFVIVRLLVLGVVGVGGVGES